MRLIREAADTEKTSTPVPVRRRGFEYAGRLLSRRASHTLSPPIGSIRWLEATQFEYLESRKTTQRRGHGRT